MINIVRGKYTFVGDQETGIECRFTRKGKTPQTFVIGRITQRQFKRVAPKGWAGIEGAGSQISFVQTLAGYKALVIGLTGPVQ